MSELGHERQPRRPSWADVSQDEALSALERATRSNPQGEDEKLVGKALRLVWLLASGGKALRSRVDRMSPDDRAIAEETAIRAGYARLESLRNGARGPRTSLVNNLVNVMSYAVKESDVGHRDKVMSASHYTAVTDAVASANRRSRLAAFEGLKSAFAVKDEDDALLHELHSQEVEHQQAQIRYVLDVEHRFNEALAAGTVAPLRTPDVIGERYALYRYYYSLYGFDELPLVDRMEMEDRLALSVELRPSLPNPALARGELKRRAEAGGGTPDEIRRRYERERKRARRSRSRGDGRGLSDDAKAAMREVFERRELPVQARRVLGEDVEFGSGAIDRYGRATSGLPEAAAAARGDWVSQLRRRVPLRVGGGDR